jgi:hypothetical protein
LGFGAVVVSLVLGTSRFAEIVLTKEEVGRLLDRLEGAPGDPLELGPARDLTPDRRFKAALEDWRGVASRYSPDELERRIYAITLNDISNVLWEALARHKISIEEFALLGEPRWRVFLDDMPSRRADMQLRKQWAKNAALTPKDSDLNDCFRESYRRHTNAEASST